MNIQLVDTDLDSLASIVGTENFLTDDYSRSLYSQDVFIKDLPALAVARPANQAELSSIIGAATKIGISVVPRGGGMSYTRGYVPANANCIIVDLGRMNRVLEINQQDMYVTVECGCTWKQLHQALNGTGLRTPYWGTLSGAFATVGGGLSQNAIFWGSGQFGSAADSVIGLEVVIADGTVIKTGSGAQVNSTPFFRHYGPDLTGLFCCDNGVLGFKSTATLRLIPDLPAKGYLAFDFKIAEECIEAMADISRKGLAMECFGFDPFLQSQRLKRASLTADVKALGGVMKSSGSLLGALKDGAKIAMAGRSYMNDVDYSVQIIVEDRIDAAVDARMSEIRNIAKQFNGREIENSIPKITRANPFGPVNNMLGPEGERWVPCHGLFAHSKVLQGYKAIENVFAKRKQELDKYNIGTGYLFAVVSTNCSVVEPVFFWPDEITEIHQQSVEAEYLAKVKKHDKNEEAKNLVVSIKTELSTLFRELGAVHLQIGKDYQYKEGLEPDTYKVIEAIKRVLDPQGKVNPQALGLE